MLRVLSSLFVVGALLAPVANAAPDKVVPYAGVIDRNGVPFSGVATLNFALFNCPAGNCANAVQLWQASGSGTFPAASAAGIA